MSRIYLIIAAIIALLSSIYFIAKLPEHYRDQGRNEVFAKWAKASDVALLKRNAENERDKLAQTETNRKVVQEYETKLQIQALQFDSRVADIKRAGGLRISSTSCRKSTGTPDTTSTARDNEAESVRLPDRVEEGLFRIARKADEINTQLWACQSWIKENGFYKE